jgi:hypothetical protein
MAFRLPRGEGVREVTGQFLLGVHSTYGGAQHLDGNRWDALTVEEPLMGHHIVGLDTGLMTLV